MSVAVLLITHADIGASILDAVRTTYGELPLPAEAISIGYDSDPESLLPVLHQKIHDVDEGQGVLVLSDVIGSTPCNLAQALSHQPDRVKVLSGLNMPMLLRVMNYPRAELAELVDKALAAGRAGVLECLGDCEKKKIEERHG